MSQTQFVPLTETRTVETVSSTGDPSTGSTTVRSTPYSGPGYPASTGWSRSTKVISIIVIIFLLLFIGYAIFVIFFVNDVGNRFRNIEGPVNSLSANLEQTSTDINLAIPPIITAANSVTQTAPDVQRAANGIDSLINEVQNGSSIVQPLITDIRDDISAIESRISNIESLSEDVINATYGSNAIFLGDTLLIPQNIKDIKTNTDKMATDLANISSAATTLRAQLCTTDPSLPNCPPIPINPTINPITGVTGGTSSTSGMTFISGSQSTQPNDFVTGVQQSQSSRSRNKTRRHRSSANEFITGVQQNDCSFTVGNRSGNNGFTQTPKKVSFTQI